MSGCAGGRLSTLIICQTDAGYSETRTVKEVFQVRLGNDMPWPTPQFSHSEEFRMAATELFNRLDRFGRNCLLTIIANLEEQEKEEEARNSINNNHNNKQDVNNNSNNNSSNSNNVNNNNSSSSSSSKSSGKKDKKKDKKKIEDNVAPSVPEPIYLQGVLRSLDPNNILEASAGDYVTSSTLLLAHYYNKNAEKGKKAEENVLSCPTHTDSGYLTIALAGEPGLQVFDQKHKYVYVILCDIFI